MSIDREMADWTTLVRSRQSMQFVLTTPDCFEKI